MTRGYFLGVDIGGTKSHALVADEGGHILGFGEAGGGNWEAVGWEGARRALHACVQAALAQAGLAPGEIAGAGYGVAGYDWPEDRAGICQLLDSLGLAAPYELANDATLGLLAGAQAGWGVVVVAGTSTNCRGRDRQGREGRATGMSSEYGEHGGAAEIVARALQAVALAWTRRGPATHLSQAFLALTGARDVEDLLAGVARERYEISPQAARRVFDVAHQGDPVAQEIIRWAGRELGDLAVGVIRQLALENEAFEVVLAGSTFNGSRTLQCIMENHIQWVAPRARLVRLGAPPVAGGVLLAMEGAGLDIQALRPALLEEALSLACPPLEKEYGSPF